MDVALSRTCARLLRAFFVLVVAFLYAPIVILLIFSFNDSAVPSFPLSGFTLHWYHEFLTNSDLKGALETSAIVAALSSLGAVVLGVLSAVGTVARHLASGARHDRGGDAAESLEALACRLAALKVGIYLV
jgi:spermidine/putrescine transport system permease protein